MSISRSFEQENEQNIKQPPLANINKEKRTSSVISPNAFYQQRQSRFTLPMIKRPKEYQNNLQQYPDEIFKLLMISNQIRALCQKDGGRIKSTKQLTQRMLQLSQFCGKHIDQLWNKSNDIDIHKCIVNISEILFSTKSSIENSLKIRFRRNALFNKEIKEFNVNIGNRLAALEMTLLGEDVINKAHISDINITSRMSRATRGELQCIEGHRLYFGHGTKKNFQRAFECYKKSADLNNSDGMNHLAMMYQKGIGVIQNINKSIEYYKLSIKLNNIEAMNNLANLYYNNLIYDDIPKAVELYKQAAEEGNIAAQTTLAGLYETGVDKYLEPNVQLSIKWYRQAANQGYLEAKNNLAVVLLNNFDSDSKEYHQAITLLTEAANDGHSGAQNNLAHCYEFGKGVEENECLALEWYEKSALQNYSASYINIGYLLMKRYQYENAFKYFLKAAKNGIDIESLYYLGLMYEKGYYVPINKYIAIEYFQKASDYGHLLSSLKIADCYFSGIANIQQNYQKSYEIYKKLAMNGHEIACNNIGIMYEEGLGIKIDIESAKMWYNIAAEKGNQDAIQNQQRLCELLGKS